MYHCATNCEVMCVWKKTLKMVKIGEDAQLNVLSCFIVGHLYLIYSFTLCVCVMCICAYAHVHVYTSIWVCKHVRNTDNFNCLGLSFSTLLVVLLLLLFFFLEAGFLTEDGVQQLVQLAGQWYVYLSLPNPGIPDMHQHAQHFSWVLEIFLALGPHICISLNYHFLCILFWWMASLDSQTKILSLILLFFLSFSITSNPFLGDYFWTPVYSKSVLSCTYFCHKPGAEYF